MSGALERRDERQNSNRLIERKTSSCAGRGGGAAATWRSNKWLRLEGPRSEFSSLGLAICEADEFESLNLSKSTARLCHEQAPSGRINLFHLCSSSAALGPARQGDTCCSANISPRGRPNPSDDLRGPSATCRLSRSHTAKALLRSNKSLHFEPADEVLAANGTCPRPRGLLCPPSARSISGRGTKRIIFSIERRRANFTPTHRSTGLDPSSRARKNVSLPT